MEKPVCKNCNQLVFDENEKPTKICILKGYVENIDDNWCHFFDSHWIVKKEEIKKKE